MDAAQNPVMTQPQRRVALPSLVGILAATAGMRASKQFRSRRVGKHHGYTKGAFGKQK